MKIPIHRRALRAFAPMAISLLAGTASEAGIIGINTGGVTNAQVSIDDTFSMNAASAPGTFSYYTNQAIWGGNPLGLSFPNMPVTADSVNVAFRAFGWNFPVPATPYGLDLMNFTVAQNSTGSGYVEASVFFRIQYQTDGGGLPASTLFVPQYVVSGTVQTGGFALVTGHLDFVSDMSGLIEQVNYGYLNSTPGAFTNQVLAPQPVNNTTSFALLPNDKLTIDGFFTIKVDPASITLSTMSTVPEPETYGIFLAGVGLLYACLQRRPKSS